MSQKALQGPNCSNPVRLSGLPARLGTLALTAALFAFSAPAVDAAVQGPSGNTVSSGSLEIDLIMGFRARITGFADMALGEWTGAGPMTANDNICVGSNTFSGSYRIRASGDGEPGDPSAFTLSNGASLINYDAYFNDAPNAGGARSPLTGGVTLAGQTGGGFGMWFNGFGCIIENSNISIEVPEAELTGGTGTYSGTLTLLLLPE